MDDLSIEAKVCVGCWWNVMMVTELSFQRPWIITPRTRKGLDELVAKGYLTVEKFNKYNDKLVWKPTDKLRNEKPRVSREFMEQHGTFPITDENQLKEKPHD